MTKLSIVSTILLAFICMFPVTLHAQESARASLERACAQVEIPEPTTSRSLDSDRIFALVNTHRAALGFHPFERHKTLCELARSRESELYDEIFVSGEIHAGIKNRDLPYRVVENMKYGHSEEEVFNWWLSSSLHRGSIEGDYQYSCATCTGRICIQLFSDFIPR